MSQPTDQACCLKPLGKVDSAQGQFWVGNPWLFSQVKFNLSCFERNRVYLNGRDGRFTEISYLTGADDEGDSRGVVAADLDDDGMCDLIVRQVGGGPVKVFMNRFPKKQFLKVSLRGVKSNSLGLGARLTAEAGDLRVHREMQAANTFWAQGPAQALFGLGDATRVDRLTIRWPSGETQVLENLPAGRHIEITEGKTEVRVIR